MIMVIIDDNNDIYSHHYGMNGCVFKWDDQGSSKKTMNGSSNGGETSWQIGRGHIKRGLGNGAFQPLREAPEMHGVLLAVLLGFLFDIQEGYPIIP